MTEQAAIPGQMPAPSRPWMPDGYGVPESADGMLPWSWASELLAAAPLYWVATTRPDGRPHTMPIWGAWVDDTFYFEGSPETRRGRNLAANPEVSVHIERGDDIVVVEGRAEEVRDLDLSLAGRIADAFGDKYEGYRPEPAALIEHGIWIVRPRTVFGWGEFPRTVTRWRFDAA